MRTPTRLMRIFLLAGGIGLGLFAAGPASAQYACPYGYDYSPTGGCVVAASPYQPYGYYGGYNTFGGFSFDSRGDRFHSFDHGGHSGGHFGGHGGGGDHSGHGGGGGHGGHGGGG
jgi:hypothetical protein